MSKVLVSLVSQQIIPNLKLIKEFKSNIDSYIFITTSDMEIKKQTEIYMKSANIPERKITKIIVSPFNFKEIEDDLLKANFEYEDEYYINITGGTKPMSIITMSFFSSLYKSKIFYVPIEENVYRQIHPRLENPEKQFTKKITLKEYFIAHNLKLESQESTVTRKISHAEVLLKKFIKYNGNVSKIDKIKNAHDMMNSEDRAYYSGGWFEELIFYKIKKFLKLNQNQIAYNVKLENNKSENEYDAVFVHNDSIYIVECKAYYGKSQLRTKVEKDLYKLGALDDNFGLKANAIYITTADIKNNSIEEYTSLSERAKSLKVKLFELSDLKNDYFLNKI